MAADQFIRNRLIVSCVCILAMIGFLRTVFVALFLPEQLAQEPVIRVSVDLVQVDAVVTDAKGHHVPNLEAADFQILVDGKLRKITRFSYVQGASTTRALPPARVVKSPHRQVSGDLPPTVTKGLAESNVLRSIVLIADDLGLAGDEIPQIRKVMNEFVDHQMQAGDLVSIMTTSSGSGIAEQFTDDKRVLHSLINKIHFMAGRTRQTWYEPVRQLGPANQSSGPGSRPYDPNSSYELLNAERANLLTFSTQATLRYAISGLRDMPGRKAVALFSDGFTQGVEQTVEFANRASVVLYTFDARGLVSFGLSAVDRAYTDKTGQNITPIEGARAQAFRLSQKSLDQLATLTGGIFFHDKNDLAQGLASALDDIGSYYLIGMKPNAEDFDRRNEKLQFHKIKVRVLPKGLTVRSRNGFVGRVDPERSLRNLTSQEILRNALQSPFRSTGLPVYLSASASASSDEQTLRFNPKLKATILIDARDLKHAEVSDGKRRLTFNVAAGIWGDGEQAIASIERTYAIEKTEEEMRMATTSGFALEVEVPIVKSGGYQLRAAVQESSGALGSARAFIEVPDFNQPHVSLSSIAIADPDVNRGALLDQAGVFGGGTAVMRVFAPGAVLDYDFQVFGARNAAVEFRLFRGAERIFAGNRQPSAQHATGQMKLPDFLPPGDYALQVLAFDGMGKTSQAPAIQWVDFTLVRKP